MLEGALAAFNVLVEDGELLARRREVDAAAAAPAPEGRTPENADIRIVVRPTDDALSQYIATLTVTRPDVVDGLTNASAMVVLVVDNSSSMGPHFARQMDAARRFIERVRDANIPLGHAYIVIFDHAVNALATVGPGCTAGSATIDAASDDALDQIGRIRSGGSTSFAAPLREVERLRRPGERLIVYFSTDGQANRGDGWEAVSRRLNASLGPEDHIVPLFFGRLPSEEEMARTSAGARGGYWGYHNQHHTQTAAVEGFRLLQTVMAFQADPRHVSDVGLLLEWINEAVTVLAENATADFGNDVRMAVFNNGETIQGALTLTDDQVEILREIGTLEGRLQVGDATMPVMAEIFVDDTPLPQTEAVMGFRMVAATRIAELRDMITAAHTGDHDALTQLLDWLQQLRDERQRLRVPADDPVAIRLVQAHDEAQRIVAGAVRTDGDASAFSVRGQTSALMQLQRGTAWAVTETHGARRVRQAERAVQRVNEAVLRNQRAVADDLARVARLLPPVLRGMDGVTLEDIAEDDPLTMENTGWNSAVVIVAGPGARFTTAVEALTDPDVTTAITNAGSAAGVVQAVLSGPSFAECIRRQLPLFRSSMTGVFVLPFRATTPEQRELLQAISRLTAMQIICGVTTRPSESGAAVFPAVAASVLLDPSALNVPAALAFAPYYCTMVGMQRRNGRPITEYLELRPTQWNGLQLTATDDNALTSLQMAMVVPAFMALVHGTPVPRRNNAVLLTTAQRGMAHRIQTEERADVWVAGHRTRLLDHFVPETTRAEPIEAATLLDRLSQHLAVIHRLQGAVSPEHLDNIVRVASRLTMAPETVELTYDHPLVTHALDFLHWLARSDTRRLTPTTHRPRESWTNTLRLMARLHALLGEDVLEATVARADANHGWLREVDVQRFLGMDVPDSVEALAAVLSPREAVWLALVMLETQGNTGRLRELGEDMGPGDGDLATIDRAFWERWMHDTDRVREAEAQGHRTLLREMVALAIDRVAARELRPDVLFGLYILAARSNYEGMMVRLFHALCSYRSVTVTQRARRTALLQLPGQAVVAALEPIRQDVLRVIGAIATEASPQEAYEDVPNSLFSLEAVQQTLREAGVSQDAIDLRLGAPGATPSMPRSSRGLNRQLRRMAGLAGANINLAIPAGAEVIVQATGEPHANVYTLPLEHHLGTLFADPHRATRIFYRGYGAGGGFVAHRIEFADGTVQARDPASDVAEERRWNTVWNDEMHAWRASVLVARRAAPADGDAAAAAPDPDGAPAPSAIAAEELTTTIETVRDLLAALPAPDYGDDGDDDDNFSDDDYW